jgi:hypothetical protein
LPAIGLLAAGGGLGAAQLWQRDPDGFFEIDIDRLDSSSPVVMANDLSFASHPGTPGWILNSLRADVRLRVTSADSSKDAFVGIARDEDVDRYLHGVAHSRIAELVDGGMPLYQIEDGSNKIAAPVDQDFWVAAASGDGTQELEWRAIDGNWSIVVMNADGSPGVSADVNAGLNVASLGRLIVTLVIVGGAMAAASAALIVTGVSHGSLRV